MRRLLALEPIADRLRLWQLRLEDSPPIAADRRRVAPRRPSEFARRRSRRARRHWCAPRSSSSRSSCSRSSPPSRAEPARACIPAAPRDRHEPPPRASPSRSPARRASRAHCRDPSASSPIGAAPARASFPPAPRNRPRPPPKAAPSHFPARRGSEAHCRDWSACSPLERIPLARIFLERRAKGPDRPFKLCRPALALAEHRERDAETLLCPRPAEWNPLARSSSRAARKAATASSSFAVPLSRSPSLISARPRLFCVSAQRSGTRSRVLSSRAAR